MAVLAVITKINLVTLAPITTLPLLLIIVQVEEVVDSIVADQLLVQDHQGAVINSTESHRVVLIW
jgi:hypothetical protein